MRLAVLAGLAGCTFHHGAAPATQMEQIVDDTAEDLAAGVTSELAVDPAGFLGPEAYIAGGLHARAFGTTPVTGTSRYADLTPEALGPILGERYGEAPTSKWNDHPMSLGIKRGYTFTVVYDGEIYLDAPITLGLISDDSGFAEIDLGGVTAIVRSDASYQSPTPLQLTPPAPGWYPFRGAMSQGSGVSYYVLSTMSGTNATPFDATRLRARVTTAPGVVVSGSPNRVFAAALAGDSIEPVLVKRDFQGQPPTYDFATLGNGDYALRYAGQVKIDNTALYGFTLNIGSDFGDYVRLMIDGATIAGDWPGQIATLSNASVQLTTGWHDVILDYTQHDQNSTIELDLTTPGASGPIPSDRLRPIRTGGLLAFVVAPQQDLVDASPDGPGVTTIPFAIPAPQGAVVDFVDLFFQLANQTRTDLAIDLDLGSASDPMPLPATPVYEGQYDYLPDHTGLAGGGAAATFQAVFTDNIQGGPVGTIYYPYLVVSYHGGPAAPFAATGTYVSALHPTTGAIELGPITVTGDLHGAAMTIEVRTSEDAPWTTVGNGAVPSIAAGDAIQYRLTITGDGWQDPTIDKIEVDYAIPAP